MPADSPAPAVDIDALERMRADATPGAWTAVDPCDAGCDRPCTPDGCLGCHPTGRGELFGDRGHEPIEHDGIALTFARLADAELAAAAHNVLPALLAELRALRRVRDAAAAYREAHDAYMRARESATALRGVERFEAQEGAWRGFMDARERLFAALDEARRG